MALDENGDPVIAFEWVDPNGDGDYSDNEVRVVHWSRATYRWLPSVRALVVGDISNQNLNPISIGCDRKTGLLAVVTPVAPKGASMVVSKDGGADLERHANPRNHRSGPRDCSRDRGRQSPPGCDLRG